MSSRRRFILDATATIGGLGLMSVLPLDVIASLRKHVAPSDRINVGLIGLRNQGWNNLRAFLKNSEVNVMAVCDIDDAMITKRKADLTQAGFPNPLVYKDYRKMLDNKDIDVILVASPDHWHCLQLTDSLSAGKHVYTEKPLANSVGEAKVMVAAAERSGKAVQVNQWQRSEKHFKDAVAFVQSGKLGTIINTKTWMYRGTVPLPGVPDASVPAGVNYDMWLGPARKRPFNPNRFHYEFRWFWDYAGGLMCDWGVLLIDIVLWAMNAGEPKTISATGGKRIFPDDARETPDYLNVTCEYPSFSNTWEHYMGAGNGDFGMGHGIAFIGSNGTLVVSRKGWEVIPKMDGQVPRMEAVPLTLKSDVGMELHARNFLDAIKNGRPDQLACPIHVAAKVAITAHMGNIAYRTGEKIHWDDAKSRFDNKQANNLIRPAYHNGFSFPK